MKKALLEKTRLWKVNAFISPSACITRPSQKPRLHSCPLLHRLRPIDLFQPYSGPSQPHAPGGRAGAGASSARPQGSFTRSSPSARAFTDAGRAITAPRAMGQPGRAQAAPGGPGSTRGRPPGLQALPDRLSGGGAPGPAAGGSTTGRQRPRRSAASSRPAGKVRAAVAEASPSRLRVPEPAPPPPAPPPAAPAGSMTAAAAARR